MHILFPSGHSLPTRRIHSFAIIDLNLAPLYIRGLSIQHINRGGTHNMISQKKRQNIIQRIKAALRENRNGLRDRVLRKGLVISKPYNESPASILIHRERARLAEACVPKVVPLEEFTLFSKLPLELRRQIWSYTLPGPRIIEVHYASEETKQDLVGLFPYRSVAFFYGSCCRSPYAGSQAPRLSPST